MDGMVRTCLLLQGETCWDISFRGMSYGDLKKTLWEAGLIDDNEEVEVEMPDGHWIAPRDDHHPMPLQAFKVLSHRESVGDDSDYESEDEMDLSYESLLLLEDVKCVAPASVVSSLPIVRYEGSEKCTFPHFDELCMICQYEYEAGEELLELPCKHLYHLGCVSQWLLNYSKLCPCCKQDVSKL